MAKKLLVRFEGIQSDGFGKTFPLFTVFKERLYKGSDEIWYSVYEPDTTIGVRTLRSRYGVRIPNKFDDRVKIGTVFELMVRESKISEVV